MKYLLFLFAGVILLFAACTKKSPKTNCYECLTDDSISSNVPAMANPHAYPGDGFHCGLTENMKNSFVKQNTYIDTFYKHDTMLVDHWTISCDLSQ